MNKKEIDKLLKTRYFLKNETCWGDIAKRVSGIYQEIYPYLLDKRIVAGSPQLMNANTKGETIGTISSCFPLAVGDSLEDIFLGISDTGIVTKFGGGVGVDFSTLRSSLETVKGIGDKFSSGPMPFISLYNESLEAVRQGGKRRGAGMAMLSIYHPDIVDFINAKQDKSKYTRFNFSVRIPNSFYIDLKKKPNNKHKVVFQSGEIISLDITTKELWDLIILRAWETGEPGIFNSDIAISRCTNINVNTQVTANPCLRDNALVLTPYGILLFKYIKAGDIIWSKEGWTKVLKKWKTGTKRVYRYTTTGGIFESTDNHEVISKGEKIQVKYAASLDTLQNEYIKCLSIIPTMVMDGLVLGDGTIHKASNNLAILHIGKKDSDYFYSEVKSLITRDRTKSFRTGWEIDTTITPDELDLSYIRNIPSRLMYLNRDNTCSLLRGLYSANGSFVGGRVSYKSASFKMIQDIQLLLSSVGISSYYTTNKKGSIKFNNGTYICKQSYDLNITTDRVKFYESIGFIQKYKMAKLLKSINKITPKLNKKTNYDIINSEFLGNFDVFDITVDNHSHTFWCNGFNISNCAEFFNIPYTACNLASPNTELFYDSENDTFDIAEYAKAVRVTTRFLDAGIDKNTFPLSKISKVTKQVRPIGVGMMGVAHLLYLMGIKYNSNKAYKFMQDLALFTTGISMDESVTLAKDKKPYDSFDYDVYMKASSRLFERDEVFGFDIANLKKNIKKYGIRNSSNTSIAPTGTISFIANTSSGIEPVFALAYTRKIETGTRTYDHVFIADPIFDKYIKSNFNDTDVSKILKYVVDHKGSCQGCDLLTQDIQDIYVVAGDINPSEHVEMLSRVSNNISLSVSKTVNLPKEATKEDVAKVYVEAHSKGVIGITVYRDECREGILVHDIKAEKGIEPIIDRFSPKRPIVLNCDIHRIQYQKEQWIAFVGLYDNRPYEIFAGKIEGITIPKSIIEGKTVKKKSRHYAFEYDGETIINNIQKTFANPEHDAFARVISLNLRSGCPIQFVIDTLNKSEGDITHFSRVLSRILKGYIKDGITSTLKCEECGSPMRYTDGCVQCTQCGVSKCG